MNFVEKKNYAFTITIPPFKRVTLLEQYAAYKDLTTEQQKDYIRHVVSTAAYDIIEYYEINFEYHKDSRVHAHGTIYAVSNDDLETFIDSVGTLIGVKTLKQKNTLCYCIPILSSYAEYCWNNYKNKDNNIPLIGEKDAQAIEGDKSILDYSKYLFGKLNK